jgi:uncharacterized membrane protein YfcA
MRWGASRGWVLGAAAIALGLVAWSATGAETVSPAAAGGHVAWWLWPLVLFVTTFALGVLAVLAGVGGAVLFVPIVGGFFPFHLDFVRGCGLLVALSASLAASPGLLRMDLASFRLAMLPSVVLSVAAIAGAFIGLAMSPAAVQTGMGIAILLIVVVMLATRRRERSTPFPPDALSRRFGINGTYTEISTGEGVEWHTRRTPAGLALFVLVGLLAGMCGLGAGWANVPVLNLVMGAPLKVSVATSMLLIATTDTAAAWVYLHHGGVIAAIVAPSIAGMMLGSWVGVHVLRRAHPSAIRWAVIGLLLVVGTKSLTRGLGLPFVF